MARALTQAERELLEFLLDADFEGRDVLATQAQTVETDGSSCDCGCPSFSLVADRSLPAVEFEDPVAEAQGRDPGGNEVGVLLFVRDGYLGEVEVFNWTGSEFDGLPRPEDLERKH